MSTGRRTPVTYGLSVFLSLGKTWQLTDELTGVTRPDGCRPTQTQILLAHDFSSFIVVVHSTGDTFTADEIVYHYLYFS